MEHQKIVFEILDEAIQRHSGDVYFLPCLEGYSIKFNVDGIDILYRNIEQKVAEECINYLKFQANMNISEKRRPQLGAWQYSGAIETINCRLSSVGDFRGIESLVIRLIYNFDYHQRYIDPQQWQTIINIARQRGLIIFSGPTGSGKTTSMYQLAQQFIDQQILSIEDPVEIFQPEILQLQVNEKAGMTYEKLLKVALRHHPDVLIVGEIRDRETAKIVVQSALSGHLVLTTVHAANCYGVIARLINLGVSLTDLEQTVRLINYQRLLPIMDNQPKVLFDQIDTNRLTVNNLIDQKGMTENWGKYLEKLLHQKAINAKTYQKYIYG